MGPSSGRLAQPDIARGFVDRDAETIDRRRREQIMGESIVDMSRDFFCQIVRPILEREFPAETTRTAFGVFGLGSEALRMDDGYSQDHHWGIRVDALMPRDVFESKRAEMLRVLGANLPASFRGHQMGEGVVAGAGIAPDTLGGFLQRTIGIEYAPRTDAEWLGLPEEDIVHVINGEVWHDPSGDFTAIRQGLSAYYPEPVWKRRIAHWCRYYSGMGTYALKRAVLRGNELFAGIAFARAIRLGIQLAFLLDRQYFPYDKWLLTFFERLPRLYERLGPIADEAVRLSTPWDRKLELLDRFSDVLDETMVADGIIDRHPKFAGSDTSGYRLMEHAYKEILGNLPSALKTITPLRDQVFLERFVVGYVDSIDAETWHEALGLRPSS